MVNDDKENSEENQKKLKNSTKIIFRDLASSGYVPDSSAITSHEFRNDSPKKVAVKINTQGSLLNQTKKLSSLINLFRFSSSDKKPKEVNPKLDQRHKEVNSKLDQRPKEVNPKLDQRHKEVKSTKDLNCSRDLLNLKEKTGLIRKLISAFNKLDKVEKKEVERRLKNESNFKKIISLILKSKDNEIKEPKFYALKKESIDIIKDKILNQNKKIDKKEQKFKEKQSLDYENVFGAIGSTELKRKSLKSPEVEEKFKKGSKLINLLIRRKKLQKTLEEDLVKSLNKKTDLNLEWYKTDLRLGCDENAKIVLEPVINSDLLLNEGYGEKLKKLAKPSKKSIRGFFKIERPSSKNDKDSAKSRLETDAKNLQMLNKDIEKQLNELNETQLTQKSTKIKKGKSKPVATSGKLFSKSNKNVKAPSKNLVAKGPRLSAEKEPKKDQTDMKKVASNKTLDKNLSSNNLTENVSEPERIDSKLLGFKSEIRKRKKLMKEIKANWKLTKPKTTSKKAIKQINKKEDLVINPKLNNNEADNKVDQEQVIKIRNLSDESTESKNVKEKFKFFNRNQVNLNLLEKSKTELFKLKSSKKASNEHKSLPMKLIKDDNNIKVMMNSFKTNKLEKTTSSDKSFISKEDNEK